MEAEHVPDPELESEPEPELEQTPVRRRKGVSRSVITVKDPRLGNLSKKARELLEEIAEVERSSRAPAEMQFTGFSNKSPEETDRTTGIYCYIQEIIKNAAAPATLESVQSELR